MKVKASALAVSCLLDAMCDTPSVCAQVEEQMTPLGLEVDWLRSQSERYRAYWRQTLGKWDHGETATVDENAVLLLSWLLAPVKNPDECARLNATVFKRSFQDFSEATSGTLPNLERISVTAGVIGCPIPVIDRDFPVRFPGGLLDSNVELAYKGLVEHVDRAPVGQWPEVYRTAVLWRLGGIVQGLAGGGENLLKCMQQLNHLLKGALPPAYRLMTADEWMTKFRSHRNVFTHVRSEADLTFKGALASHEQHDQLLDYIRVATFYVAVSINELLAGIEPETVMTWVDVVDDDQEWASSFV